MSSPKRGKKEKRVTRKQFPRSQSTWKMANKNNHVGQKPDECCVKWRVTAWDAKRNKEIHIRYCLPVRSFVWWDVETTFPRETPSAKSRPSDKFVSSCLNGARPLFSGEQSEWLINVWLSGKRPHGKLMRIYLSPCVYHWAFKNCQIVIVSREKNQSEKFSHLQYVVEVNR